MLGKRPCILRTTSSRSLLIPCEDSDGESAAFCNYGQVTPTDPGPALCSPCKIVIGFEVGAEKKPLLDVCESPRSVLDSSAVLSSQEKQQIVARSPRSGLGSLLAAKSGSEENVGLGVAQAPAVPVNVADINKHPNQNIIALIPVQSPSKVTAWPAKMSNLDPVDDVCQGKGVHVNLQAGMEDELLDADISPLRVGSCMYLNEEMKNNINTVNTPMAMSHFVGNGAKSGSLAADFSTEQKQAHLSSNMDVTNSAVVQHVNARNKGSIHDGMQASSRALLANSVHLRKGNCTEGDVPCQEQFWHHSSLDVEEVGTQQSIFSTSSPPPRPGSLVRASPGFLKICNFCGHSLRLGKDIFMYRGDQPFCSAECRYEKIVLDESKDRCGG